MEFESLLIFSGLASTADDQKYEILGKYELKSGSLSKTVRSKLNGDLEKGMTVFSGCDLGNQPRC